MSACHRAFLEETCPSGPICLENYLLQLNNHLTSFFIGYVGYLKPILGREKRQPFCSSVIAPCLAVMLLLLQVVHWLHSAAKQNDYYFCTLWAGA